MSEVPLYWYTQKLKQTKWVCFAGGGRHPSERLDREDRQASSVPRVLGGVLGGWAISYGRGAPVKVLTEVGTRHPPRCPGTVSDP